MGAVRRGYIFAFAAYGYWGVFPLYFKLLRPATPMEILAHRIVWSAVFMAVVLVIARRGERSAGCSAGAVRWWEYSGQRH